MYSATKGRADRAHGRVCRNVDVVARSEIARVRRPHGNANVCVDGRIHAVNTRASVCAAQVQHHTHFYHVFFHSFAHLR